MRQTNEKIDPLMRIQEEIKEVVRREEEYRQLVTGSGFGSPAVSVPAADGEDHNSNASKTENVSNDNDNDNDIDQEIDIENGNENENDSNENSLTLSPSPTPPTTTSMVTPGQDDNSFNTPSLSSSINSKESLELEHHSDDSGISGSSSPVNGTSAVKKSIEGLKINKDCRYIGPNCYNMTPEPPQQKHLPLATPNSASIKPRPFNFSGPQRGLMERFIASRGKLQLNGNGPGSITNANGNGNQSNQIFLNAKVAAALLGVSSPSSSPVSPMSLNSPPDSMGDYQLHGISPSTGDRSMIERDSEGKPLRRGYVPVELKIQRELKDLKTRESELKKIRKIRQSTSDLVDAVAYDNQDSDEDDSDVEHCYGPRKLRSTKSISELCESQNSLSSRATPSPDFDSKYRPSDGMRPAMSLAQLCDLQPEDAPSSHRLIQQWENIIQQNA